MNRVVILDVCKKHTGSIGTPKKQLIVFYDNGLWI